MSDSKNDEPTVADLVEGMVSGEIQRNIILLSDRKITEKEVKLLDQMNFDAVKFQHNYHKNQAITNIAHGDFFIIEIDNPFWGGRSHAMQFIETNLKYFNDFVVVFLRSGEAIRKDNMDQFNADFIIKDLPKKTKSRDTYLRILMSDKLPQVRGKLRQWSQWIFSKGNKKK